MNLKYYYWYFQSAIPEKICDDIVKYALSQEEVEGVTGGIEPGTDSKDKQVRNSDLVWLNERWIYNEIHPFINMANKNAGWNFDWDWSETLQFTKYKTNQHYNWHQDAWDSPYTDEHSHSNYKGKIRKLSISVILSNENDYEGGDFQFDYRHKYKDDKKLVDTVKGIRPKGSVLVFPSYLWHKVTPVTSGTRYSLVNWVLGNPYK